MRHDGRAKNADADVKHPLVGYNVGAGNEAKQNAGRAGLGENEFGCETTADGGDEGDDDGLDIAKAFCLQIQDQQHIQGSDDAPPHQGNAEKELQPDGRANHFRQITCGDGKLAKNPEEPDRRC